MSASFDLWQCAWRRLAAPGVLCLGLLPGLPLGAADAVSTASQAAPVQHATERVTLRNGFDLICSGRRPLKSGHVRLTFHGDSGDYLDVAAEDILRVEPAPEGDPHSENLSVPESQQANPKLAEPTREDILRMAAEAGGQHQLDPDLIASVIAAESGFRVRAVSRSGAQGLMQLMPKTAAGLGVQDAFHAQQNVAGGTAYLDQLLVLYRDNLALALAAYNAGPAAVAKYHGIPPYTETRRYVARVIHDFNRRKLMALSALALRP